MDKHKGLDIAVTARAGTASEQEVNLATLVKRLHEKATTIRHSLAEIPPVNPLDSSQPRKKAWFTRSRTGCLACRCVCPRFVSETKSAFTAGSVRL